ADIPSHVFLRTPFESLASTIDLSEFTVLNVEHDRTKQGRGGSRLGADSPNDANTTPRTHTRTRTHLGSILQPGDAVMGYHLTNSNFNSELFAALLTGTIPDVILVHKSYPNRRKKSKAHNWRLRSVAKEVGEEGETRNARGVVGRMGGRDRKVEDDYELHQGINLYKA
ncbi:hypothetical protein BDQ17DRAFT_1199399, partial [Cyathus striatus]